METEAASRVPAQVPSHSPLVLYTVLVDSGHWRLTEPQRWAAKLSSTAKYTIHRCVEDGIEGYLQPSIPKVPPRYVENALEPGSKLTRDLHGPRDAPSANAANTRIHHVSVAKTADSSAIPTPFQHCVVTGCVHACSKGCGARDAANAGTTHASAALSRGITANCGLNQLPRRPMTSSMDRCGVRQRLPGSAPQSVRPRRIRCLYIYGRDVLPIHRRDTPLVA